MPAVSWRIRTPSRSRWTPPREDGTIVYHLSVAEGDMGRVIGKQGRIAKAIRVVMRAAAVRVDEKVLVEID